MEAADCGSVDGGGVCVVASVASICSLTLACVSGGAVTVASNGRASVSVAVPGHETAASDGGSGVGGGSIRMSDATDGGGSGGGRDCDVVEKATGRERR